MSFVADKPGPLHVAAIFLERTRGYFLKAHAHPAEAGLWSLQLDTAERVKWQPESETPVEQGLEVFGEIIDGYRDEISCLGVASYGPFISLTPGPNYGTIKDTADPPLNGQNLFGYVGGILGKSWLDRDDTRFRIETDASACAVGEAYLRGSDSDHVLAYLFATKGIGVGFVRGREVVMNALHPEIGLLPAFPHPGDPIAKKNPAVPFNEKGHIDFQSISSLSNEEALRNRYRMMNSQKYPMFSFDNKKKEARFWDLRAFYLAEACVACTVVNPPHQIVIGADLDPLGDVEKRTWNCFEEFMKGRDRLDKPWFDYTELREGFISRPMSGPGKTQPAPPAVSGAIGLCYLAAASSAEPKKVDSKFLIGAYDGRK